MLSPPAAGGVLEGCMDQPAVPVASGRSPVAATVAATVAGSGGGPLPSMIQSVDVPVTRARPLTVLATGSFTLPRMSMPTTACETPARRLSATRSSPE